MRDIKHLSDFFGSIPASVPLCIDLDGTLIEEESHSLCWPHVFRLSRLFAMARGWLMHGQAGAKYQLYNFSPKIEMQLTFRDPLLQTLRLMAQHGRHLVLATGAPDFFAQNIANMAGCFHQVLASGQSHNLVGNAKADALCQLFGKGQFLYAGNSYQDIPVWRAAGYHIIVGNCPRVNTWLNRGNLKGSQKMLKI